MVVACRHDCIRATVDDLALQSTNTALQSAKPALQPPQTALRRCTPALRRPNYALRRVAPALRPTTLELRRATPNAASNRTHATARTPALRFEQHRTTVLSTTNDSSGVVPVAPPVLQQHHASARGAHPCSRRCISMHAGVCASSPSVRPIQVPPRSHLAWLQPVARGCAVER